MTNQTQVEVQLTMYARNFLRDEYEMDMSIPLVLNGRLKRSMGRFMYMREGNRPVRVEMNRDFVNNNDIDLILDVLKHELVHYALCYKGMDFSDGDSDFENELSRLGVISQKDVDKITIKSTKQVYDCKECNHRYTMNRRLRNNGINHSCKCGGKLKDMGKMVIED